MKYSSMRLNWKKNKNEFKYITYSQIYWYSFVFHFWIFTTSELSWENNFRRHGKGEGEEEGGADAIPELHCTKIMLHSFLYSRYTSKSIFDKQQPVFCIACQFI